MFYFISFFLLLSSYKSNNPLTSALCLILALVSISPLMTLISHVWFVYLMLMLFLTGLLVIVIYFASLSVYVYKVIGGTTLFFITLLFYPYLVVVIANSNTMMLFSNYFLVLYIIFKLLFLILFSSYMLSQSAAMRRL